MKTKRMSLASIQGKLSRAEMKKIMAGSEGCSGSCGKWVGGATGHWEAGTCGMGSGLPGLPPTCNCSVSGGTGCA